MRNITKIRRSVRAISPVISVLLMIAIAVIASLVAYAWVMGYMNFQTGKAGQSIVIQSYAVSADGTTMYVYVQNNGQGSVTFTPGTCAYINDFGRTAVVDDTTIDGGQTTLFTVSGLSLDITQAVKVRIVTTSGVFAEVKGVPLISGGASHVPTAFADSYSVVRNTVLTVTAPGVLANDHYVTIAEKVSDPSQGTLTTFNADGSFQYTAPDAVVVDSFTYRASDGTTYTTPVTVTINVVNELPALDSFDVVADAGDKVQNVPFGITVTAKDQYGSIFTGWSGPNTLGASSGTIDPTSTGTFTAGVWTGDVTLSDAGSITITTTGGTKTGASAPITVLAQYYADFALGTGGDSMSPADGSHILYVEGTVVPLSAEALTDYHFTEWTATGSIVITNPTSEDGATATINSAGTITANFEADAPPTVAITITSSPAGAGYVIVDGNPITTPQTFDWVPGSSHPIIANSPVIGGVGTQYVFTSWSDTGAISHDYIVSTADTVTANYKTQYQVTFAVVGSGSMTPSGTNVWIDEGPLAISATANSGSHFTTWSATAGITINNPTTNPNTATIGATGTITANFETNTPVTIILRPNGDGSYTQLYRSSWSGSNYQYVDDTGDGDGSSTYVYDSDQNNYDTDTYAIENHGSEAGTITSVTVHIRAMRSGSDTCYGRAILRVGSTNYDNSDTFTLASSWTEYSTTFNSNPAGGSWGSDWSVIDSIQAGVSLNSGDTQGGSTSYARCTQVWIEVTYIPA